MRKARRRNTQNTSTVLPTQSELIIARPPVLWAVDRCLQRRRRDLRQTFPLPACAANLDVGEEQRRRDDGCWNPRVGGAKRGEPSSGKAGLLALGEIERGGIASDAGDVS